MDQRYGSDVIVDLLRGFGIEYVAVNPGASYRGLHDSVVNYGENHPEMITCTHEEIAVEIAHGYAKVTGKPMAAIVHDVVGLLHSCMAVYYAHVDRVPLILLGATGPVDRWKRRPYIDWIHSSLVNGNAIRDYVKWDDQPASHRDFAPSFARAYRIATTEPAGPVYLCYDAGLQEDGLEAKIDVARYARAARPAPLQADPAALARTADLLAAAERPVILTEFTGRHVEAFRELVGLAEESAAAVIDLDGRLSFPNRHPQALTHDALAEADLVLAVDVFDLERPLNILDRLTNEKRPRMPEECRVVDLGLAELRTSKWSEDLGQLQPVDLTVTGDTRLALPALRELLRARPAKAGRAARRVDLARRHDAQWAAWAEEAKTDWGASPMTAPRLASEIWGVIKGEDWLLTGADLEGWVFRLWDFDHPGRHIGRSMGTATQIGTAVGAALALRGTGRLVVDVQPDGDLLFDPGALWTVANQRLPMLVVMYNNRAYFNDWEHQLRIAEHRGTDKARANIGMDLSDPAPDFGMLARSLGWYGEGPITDPEQVGPALRRALDVVKKERRPALVDTIVRQRTPARYR